jgi:hypothetical protein
VIIRNGENRQQKMKERNQKTITTREQQKQNSPSWLQFGFPFFFFTVFIIIIISTIIIIILIWFLCFKCCWQEGMGFFFFFVTLKTSFLFGTCYVFVRSFIRFPPLCCLFFLSFFYLVVNLSLHCNTLYLFFSLFRLWNISFVFLFLFLF